MSTHACHYEEEVVVMMVVVVLLHLGLLLPLHLPLQEGGGADGGAALLRH